jgi:hypothetical protein
VLLAFAGEPGAVAKISPLPLLDSLEREPQVSANWEAGESKSPVVVIDPLVFDLPTIGEVV